MEEDLEVGPHDRRRHDRPVEPLDAAVPVHERPSFSARLAEGRTTSAASVRAFRTRAWTTRNAACREERDEAGPRPSRKTRRRRRREPPEENSSWKGRDRKPSYRRTAAPKADRLGAAGVGGGFDAVDPLPSALHPPLRPVVDLEFHVLDLQRLLEQPGKKPVFFGRQTSEPRTSTFEGSSARARSTAIFTASSASPQFVSLRMDSSRPYRAQKSRRLSCSTGSGRSRTSSSR